jgi:DNA-binding PadR family transcriptional regulator
MEKTSVRYSKNDLTEMELGALKNLAVLSRWCKPSELLAQIQEVPDRNGDRHIYPVLHRFVELGWAERRQSGGGARFPRYEFNITPAGAEYIRAIIPVETITTPGTEEYARIVSYMRSHHRAALRRFAEQPEGVWCAPKVIRDVVPMQINTSFVCYDLTALNVLEQVEWARHEKPTYRYQINDLGLRVAQYLDSLNQ